MTLSAAVFLLLLTDFIIIRTGATTKWPANAVDGEVVALSKDIRIRVRELRTNEECEHAFKQLHEYNKVDNANGGHRPTGFPTTSWQELEHTPVAGLGVYKLEDKDGKKVDLVAEILVREVLADAEENVKDNALYVRHGYKESEKLGEEVRRALSNFRVQLLFDYFLPWLRNINHEQAKARNEAHPLNAWLIEFLKKKPKTQQAGGRQLLYIVTSPYDERILLELARMDYKFYDLVNAVDGGPRQVAKSMRELHYHQHYPDEHLERALEHVEKERRAVVQQVFSQQGVDVGSEGLKKAWEEVKSHRYSLLKQALVKYGVDMAGLEEAMKEVEDSLVISLPQALRNHSTAVDATEKLKKAWEEVKHSPLMGFKEALAKHGLHATLGLEPALEDVEAILNGKMEEAFKSQMEWLKLRFTNVLAKKEVDTGHIIMKDEL